MLYEMTINISIFLFFWFILRKRDHKDGFIFATYLMLYSLGRFVVESFRADSLMMGPIRAAQAASLTLAVAALFAILKGILWKK